MRSNTQIKQLEQVISQEVYVCQTSLIEGALKQQFFCIDDLDNMYRPFDGKLLQPATCTECKTTVHFLDSKTGRCEECYQSLQEPQEIYEWWHVSPWMGRMLLLEGEPILDNEYGLWWGRCTTGQALSMDDVLQKIYHSLTGQ